MARFCIKCGQGVEAAHRFCDTCGAPLAAAPQPRPAPGERPRRPSLRLPGTRSQRLRALGLGTVVLAAAGAALWFFLREPPLPDEARIDALLPELMDVDEARCVANFDYSKNPVQVANYDSRTRALLDLLVNAGVYQGPTVVTQGEGFFRSEALEYRHGDAAAQFIQDKRLCFAEGVMVDRVEFGARVKGDSFPTVSARIQYKLSKPAAWSESDAAAKAHRSFRDKQQGRIETQLKYENGQWTPMSPSERIALTRFVKQQARASHGNRSLLDFFSANPGKPIFGTWRGEGLLSLTSFEFREDRVRFLDESRSEGVSYRQDGKDILVSVKGEKDELRVRVIAEDQIQLDMGGEILTLHRVP